jgi:hypothetical protein
VDGVSIDNFSVRCCHYENLIQRLTPAREGDQRKQNCKVSI